MKIKQILIIFILSHGSFNVTCQINLGTEGNIGFSLPSNSDLGNVYDVGLNLELAMPIAVLKENELRIKPLIGLLWYFKEIEEVNSITEHTRIFKYGLEAEYIILTKESFSISSYMSLINNSISNYYSSTSYNPFDNTSTTSKSEDFMKGNQGSLQIGSFIRIDDFFFKLGYNILKPTLHVNKLILGDLERNGIIAEPSINLNFNSLNVSFGYTYWF